jgi:NADH:ubiquinone oxidoreductase subunit 3 (subunit A)
MELYEGVSNTHFYLFVLFFIIFHLVVIIFALQYHIDLYPRNSVTQICINFSLIIPFLGTMLLQFIALYREAPFSLSLSFYASFCVSDFYLTMAELDSRNM